MTNQEWLKGMRENSHLSRDKKPSITFEEYVLKRLEELEERVERVERSQEWRE